MIKTQELYQTSDHDFEELSQEIKQILSSTKCINCSGSIQDEDLIDYVLMYNGKVKWWHRRNQYIMSCTVKKKLFKRSVKK